MTIEYYWRPGCPFCMSLTPRVRALAEQAGVSIVEHNIWEDQDAAARVRSAANGNETVPTVFIGEKSLVNPKIGAVKALLAESDPSLDLPADRSLWQRLRGR
ncbi:glutaredoxin family protein [Pseudonocardia spinosispora]|uniref:glutaredoxin family protein n=1 Tax=Pseudonocardia spinosispora TaxID=103441 RepID=UPI00041F38FC|nr:glutaredoxin domain-containing protein [Pseudonocardia spinosispora]